MEWKNTNKRKIVGNVKSKQKAKHLLFYFIIGLNGVNQAIVSEKWIFVFYLENEKASLLVGKKNLVT